MGNCFRSESHQSPIEILPASKSPDLPSPLPNLLNLPRIISISRTSILICLNSSPTPESSRLKASLKGAFGNVVLINSERRLLNLLKSRSEGKHYIVIAGKVGEQTVKSLVDDSKVTAIYLCLGKPKPEEIPQATKIKGFFEKRIDLKRAICDDIYDDKSV